MTDDDTLVLYYYYYDGPDPQDAGNDGLTEAGHQRITRALQSDPDLARRYEALSRDLDGLPSPADTRAPDEAVMRWHYELDRAITDEAPATGRTKQVAWLAAAAAVLVLGIAIGLNMDQGRPADPATVSTSPAVAPNPIAPRAPIAPPASTAPAAVAMRPAAFTRGLASHMQQSRLQLDGLKDAGTEERAQLIARIIEQNRAFQRTAEANGAPDLARVLRAFEQPLNELAKQETTDRAVEAGADQLSFELAVMLTKLSQPPSLSPHSL